MSYYEIPPEHIDPRKYPNVPAGGILFTSRFSDWITAHLDRVKVGMVNNKVHVEINDPVTLISYEALTLAAFSDATKLNRCP